MEQNNKKNKTIIPTYAKVKISGLIANCRVNPNTHAVILELKTKNKMPEQMTQTVALVANDEKSFEHFKMIDDGFRKSYNEFKKDESITAIDYLNSLPEEYIDIEGRVQRRKTDAHKFETYVRAERYRLTDKERCRMSSEIELNGIISSVEKIPQEQRVIVTLKTTEDKSRDNKTKPEDILSLPVIIDTNTNPALTEKLINERITAGQAMRIKGEAYGTKVTSDMKHIYNMIKIHAANATLLVNKTKKKQKNITLK